MGLRKRKQSDDHSREHEDYDESSMCDSAPGSSVEPTKASSEPLLADSNDRWRKWNIRTASTIVMLGSFVVIISSGHVSVGLLVLVLQVIIFNEIVGLRYERMQKIGIPHFRFTTWYFYVACVFYAYGRVLRDLIDATFPEHKWVTQYHAFASFVVYVVGILMFILNLRKGLYRAQFAQFAWTHMTLLLVVVQSTLMLHNIFEGLIWFLLPCLLVITNDIMGFIFGFFFGKTPLIKLSPKKTWEGFVGALVSTTALSFLFARLMSQSDHLVCPQPTLHFGTTHCVPGQVFIPREFAVPEMISEAVHAISGITWETVRMRPMQIHALSFGLFASLIAPFGGFFASGFKRAFRIKDFSSTIPGHGGLTDRMDCQILMAVFATVYYTTFVATAQDSIAQILTMVTRLPAEEQLVIANKIFQANGISN